MTAKTDWWSRRSAADDYLDDEAEVIDTDDDAWLDTFEFDEAPEAKGDRLGHLWGRYTGRPSEGSWASTQARSTQRTIAAHRVVQGFVDTFATDGTYKVHFDGTTWTAGSSLDGRIVITTAPLEDKTLTDAEVHAILTALAVHEAAHLRYSKDLMRKAAKHPDPRAPRVANLLCDVHDERAFATEYPGFGDDIFAPAMAYIARTLWPSIPTPSSEMDSVFSMGIAAVRYDEYTAWAPEHEAERQWWRSWSDRHGAYTTTRQAMAGVEEALAHLGDATDEDADDQPGQPTAGEPGGTGMGDGETTFPVCWADALQEMGDVDAAHRAEAIAAMGEHLTDDGNGEIWWGPKGVARSRRTVVPSPAAGAAIRAAFARSRTGTYAVEHGLRRGRLTNHGLHRLADNDGRIFARRQAQSEGRYRIWLMVDCSVSMSVRPLENAMEVSAALAAAVRMLPNVSLDVWGWTSGQKVGAGWSAVRVYGDGSSVADIGYLGGLTMGGTPDADVLRWADGAIRKHARPGETPIVIMASDGQGRLSYEPSIVTDARKHGVAVLSVAIGSIREADQQRIYGSHGYVPWRGSIAALAGPLGRIIGRIAAGGEVRA